MSTTTDRELIWVTCPDCGCDRQVQHKTARNIDNGRASPRCLSCGITRSQDTRHTRVRSREAKPDGVTPRPEFFDDALCAQVGSDLFFPGKGDDGREAKAVCARCDVRERCLEWALSQPASHDQDGIYGGTSPRQRARIRAERKEAA